MKYCVEPYVKDNNLLQLGLFHFADKRPEKTCTNWSDERGNYELRCICGYGVPGSFDQDVYAACMRIWVKQGMKEPWIKLNYSDIARELHLSPPRAWVGRIKESLKRLAQARYEFTQCFLQATADGVTQINTHFSLFDSASLFSHEQGKSKRNSQSVLIFPDEIQKNLEAKYYQFLDMVWYRALPEGLPRRLYEYLAKRHYHNVNGEFTISEEAICRWLPIMDKNVTNRRKRLVTIAQGLITAGFLREYRFDTKKRQCTFVYAKDVKMAVEKIVKEAVLPPMLAAMIEDSQPMEDIPAILPQANCQSQPQAIAPPQTITPQPVPQQFLQQQSSGQPEVNDKTKAVFLEALKWLETLPYFHKKRRDEIAALAMSDVGKCYPGIRQRYEELASAKQAPKPGWVYNAFTEQWRFEDKQAKATRQAYERCFTDTPEGRWARAAKELFDSWPPTEQEKFMFCFQKYVQQFFASEAEWQALLTGEKKWGSWLPKFMEVSGLIKPASAFRDCNLEHQAAALPLDPQASGNLAAKLEAMFQWQTQQDRQQVEERLRRQQEQARLAAEKALVQPKIAQLPLECKLALWRRAEELTSPTRGGGRESGIKVAYFRLLVATLNQQGEQFSNAIMNDLSLAMAMEKPRERGE